MLVAELRPLLILPVIIMAGLVRLIGLLLELFEPGVEVPEEGELEAIVEEPELFRLALLVRIWAFSGMRVLNPATAAAIRPGIEEKRSGLLL